MRKPVHGLILALVAMVICLLSDWFIRPTNAVVADEWDMITGLTFGFGFLYWLFAPNRGT